MQLEQKKLINNGPQLGGSEQDLIPGIIIALGEAEDETSQDI